MSEEQINTEQVDTQQQEEVKTVSVAEMQRRLAQAEERHKAETETLISKALEKYKAENELKGEELEEYRRQEAEREKQVLLDEINALKKDKTHKELTDEAIKTLGNRSLPVNDKTLAFVVKDTADDTLKAIDDLESIINDIKNQYTQSEPPITSNSIGSGSSGQSRADIFRNANIRNKK